MSRFQIHMMGYPSTVVDYVRVVLLGAGIICHVQGHPLGFVGLVTTSFLLDVADGMLARRLGQTSRFGEVLDFGIDLITHTVLWILSGFPFAPVMILLEWGGGLSVLWFSSKQGTHWKTTLTQVNVKLVQWYFANHQRNVLAVFAGISHFGFRIGWYLGYGERWPADIFVPGIILFEVVTAYMMWMGWRMRSVRNRVDEA